MLRHLLPLALAALAACQIPASKPVPAEPAPSEDELMARVIGLTDELDRLGRRVAAMEQALGIRAPAAAPAPEAAPVPAVPPPAPAARPASTAASGRVSGLLIDARSAATEGAKRPAGTRHERWRILDYRGTSIVSAEDVPEDLRRVLPVFWLAPSDRILGPEVAPTLGDSRLALPAAFAEIYTHESGEEEVLLYIDNDAATRLRSLPDLPRILATGNLAIVLSR